MKHYLIKTHKSNDKNTINLPRISELFFSKEAFSPDSRFFRAKMRLKNPFFRPDLCLDDSVRCDSFVDDGDKLIKKAPILEVTFRLDFRLSPLCSAPLTLSGVTEEFSLVNTDVFGVLASFCDAVAFLCLIKSSSDKFITYSFSIVCLGAGLAEVKLVLVAILDFIASWFEGGIGAAEGENSLFRFLQVSSLLAGRDFTGERSRGFAGRGRLFGVLVLHTLCTLCGVVTAEKLVRYGWSIRGTTFWVASILARLDGAA